MKKILIACVGLLLMVSYGCSSEDAKESAEKTKEVVIEAQEEAAEMTSEAAIATEEATTEAKDKAVEMGSDAVQTSKKKAAIEGC